MKKTEYNIVSHSNDQDIRKNSSSGGFCKSFLTYLVESKTVDFVIMTRMKEDSTEPESIITNDKNKIITRSNSIYEYHDQTKILNSIENDKKYAFIGLPCFVRHIKNQQLKNKKYLNIFPLISILCNQAPNPDFKKQLLKNNNIDIDQVLEIDYRYGNYPGDLVIKLKDESIKNLGYFRKKWSEYNDPGFRYAPNCCLSCELFESAFADIVVGDPWLTQYEKDTNGWTKVIVRNEESMKLIQKSVIDNYLTIKKLEENESFLAYKHSKEYKQSAIKKLIVPPTPEYPGSLGDKAILLSIEKNNADLLVCNTKDSFWQNLNFDNLIDINHIDVKKYDEVHFYPTDTIDGVFGDGNINLFYRVSSLFTNTKTKIFFNTFSYGPNPSQKSIDYLQKLNAIFSLRDQYSLERFKKFYPNHLCFLQPDPAFNLGAKKPKEEVNISSNSVGICPANHEYDKYSKIIELCIKKGYNPVLILHDLRSFVGDISLCDKLSENYKIPIMPTQDPREIKYLLSKMSFVITGRMHVAILAMGAGTKAYGFDYNHKMKGTFKIKNQENNVIQRIEEIYEIQ